MATMTYKEQLLHPNWQRKRLEILQRDEFTCQYCFDRESTLHVHHKQYAKGRLAWEYPDDELVTLCGNCHETMHEHNALIRDVIAKLPVDGPCNIASAASLLAGWANDQRGMKFDGEDSDWIGNDPDAFLLGGVALLLERCLRMGQVYDLREALTGCPRHVVVSAVANLIRELVKQKALTADQGERDVDGQ